MKYGLYSRGCIIKELLALFMIILVFPIFARAEIIELSPVKDTYVDGSRANRSYGTSKTLSIKDGTAYRGKGKGRELLVQFDLSQFPEGVEILSAKLKLYVTTKYKTNNATYTYAVLGEWNEFTTWKKRPPRASTYEDSVPIATTKQYYEWDVTYVVQDWVDGVETNYGITVVAEGGEIYFSSREAGSNLPILTIEYELTATSEEIGSTKVIEFGWDKPDTEFVNNNISKMEEMPFDGVVIKALDGNYPLHYSVFSSEYMNSNDFLDDISNLQTTNFQKFTDNFLLVDVVPGDVDWFDDWGSIINNIELAARIAKEGGLKGIFLDVETYQFPLFSYPDQKYSSTRSFEDYREQAKLRGKQLIEAINSVYPDITIFLTYGYSSLLKYSSLPDTENGLLPTFLDGILGNCDPATRVIDGYEQSYSFKNEEDYIEGYYQIKEDGLTLTDVPDKYESQLKAGFGLWIDYYWQNYAWDTNNFSNNYFTPAEFEDAASYALKYSESYVWVYSQKVNWWTRENLPEDYIQALESAKSGSQQ